MSNQNQVPATQGGQVAVAKKPRQIDVLKSVLNAPSVQEQFGNALKEHKDAFVASIIDLYNGDTALQACNPNQVVSEALKAATMNLPINRALGFAYIVVYNNSVKQPDGTWVKVPTPTFVPGYKGYIQLAMRTGQYKNINADIVYEGEIRKVNKLTGEIAFDGERTSDKVAGYFCYFELLNGFAKTLYMSVRDMASYAKRYSPSVKAATTIEQLEQLANAGVAGKKVGWEGNFNDMALKTVIRRLLSKYGYLSIEMQGAMANDVDDMSQRDAIMSGATIRQLDADVTYEEVVPVAPANAEAQTEAANDGPGY
jgi:recombination protein RecT